MKYLRMFLLLMFVMSLITTSFAKQSGLSLLQTSTSVKNLTTMSVIIISPNGGECWVSGSTQIVKWQTSDTGFAKYRLLLSRDSSTYNDTIAHNIAPNETTYNWIVPILNLNTCRLKIQILDNLNNILTEDESDSNFIIDSEQPSIFNLIFPHNSTWANGLPKFIWQHSIDVSLSHYQLFIDGILRKDSIMDTTYTLLPPQLSEGWRTWFIRAVDRIGLWRQSTQTYSVRIDTLPPNTFNLVAPADNIWTTGSDLIYNWQASSDIGSGLMEYQLWIDGSLNHDNIPAYQNTTTQIGVFPSGIHTWQIKAVDSAGNSQVSNQTRILKIDITPPEAFNLSSPTDSVWINQHYPRFFWHTTQDTNVGLSLYKLYMYNYGFGINWARACSASGWSVRRWYTSPVFDNKMWMLGGYYNGNERNDVWYSSNGINWTRACSSAGWSARYGHTSIVFDNKIWVIGGYDNSYRNDVWYSADGVNWTRACSSAGWSGRRFHTSIVYDNKIWVIGGYGNGYKNDVWYSIDGINWTQATASAGWSTRYGHTSVIFDNKMWVLGGYTGVHKNDVWYSTNGVNWTQASASASWIARRYHTSVVFDNKIWIMGGYDNNNINDVWYSNNGATWSKATDSARWSARYGHTTIVYDNKTWIIGGYDGNYRNDVWFLDNNADTISIRPPDTSVVFINSLLDGKHPWEVLAYDSLGNCRNSNQLWSVNIDSTPPTVFTLISPPDSTIRQIPTPTLVWQRSSDIGIGFKKYELWIDNIKNIDSLGQNDTTTAPATLLSEGFHTWFVKAVDRLNNIQKSIQTYTVILDWNLPDTFSLSSPRDNETTATQQPKLYWHPAHDVGSGIKKYQLLINGIVNRDSIPANDTSAFPVAPLPNNSNNTWFVKVFDNANQIRSSNQTWRFITKDVVSPTTPTLILPLNNVYTKDTMPRFWWNKSYDLTGVDHYQLQYAMNSIFTGVITVDVYDTTYQVPARLLDTTYYWRVNAVDFGGNWSEWSSVWQFEIDTRIPVTPVLLEPINGVWRNTSNVLLSWTQVILIASKIKRLKDEKTIKLSKQESSILRNNDFASPVRYIIQVDTNRNFSLPLVIDTTSLSQETTNLSEQRYFWRIRTYDLSGNQGVFSGKDSFGVDVSLPSIPILVYPDSGLFTNTSTITFKWRRSSDNLSGVKFYTLQYGTSVSFINPFTIDSIIDTTGISFTLGDSTYYWRVRTKDKAGNVSDWSQVRSFRIYTQVPSAPVLLVPINTFITNSSNINFIWFRSPSPVINFYKLQYSRNSTFTTSESIIRYDTTYTLTLLDTIYYWRVKAVDSAGNISTWSSVWSFEVDTRVPNVPSLISPINGIWLTNNPTIFHWSQVTFDSKSQVRYLLQIDTSRNFTNPLFDTTSLVYDTITLNQARFFWRIRAFDLAGNQSVYSGRDSFGIDYTAPSVPNLLSPANNAMLTDSFVRFYWNLSIDNISGILNYRIQIAHNANFTNPIDLTFNDTTLLTTLRDTVYYWRVKAIDRANNESNWSTVRNFRVSTTGITENITSEPIYMMLDIYPNPTKSDFMICFALPFKDHVSLLIYDRVGKLVKTLVNGHKQSGIYSFNWNCEDDNSEKVSQGIYFCILKANNQIIQKKTMLLR